VLSFAHAGALQQFENRLPVQGFAVALLLLLSAAVQRRCSPLIAVMALCAFTATNFLHIGITCYADVMLAFAMLAAVDGWLRWQESGDRSWFALACIGLAAALFSKNEGSLLAAAALLALLLARLLRVRKDAPPQAGRALLWLCVPLFAVLVHRGFNSHFGVSNDLLDPQFGKGQGLFERIVSLFPERAWTVAEFYGGLLIDRGPGPDGEITHLPLGRLLVLSFFVAAAGLGRRLRQGTTGALLLFVAIALIGYMLVFVGTYQWLEWRNANRRSRMVPATRSHDQLSSVTFHDERTRFDVFSSVPGVPGPVTCSVTSSLAMYQGENGRPMIVSVRVPPSIPPVIARRYVNNPTRPMAARIASKRSGMVT
jgi:4-amino-4-deoxy-L-arabinose transferase-like glycosyltransferase